MKYRIICLILILFSPLSWSHKSSDSFINLIIDDSTITGRWDIALRDLEYIMALDRNADGAINWFELRTRFMEIQHYAFSHLQLNNGSNECTHKTGLLQVDHHTDGAYAVINFDLDCHAAIEQLTINYQLLFDLDPTHRGLVQITQGNKSEFRVFSPDIQQANINFRLSNRWQTLRQFISEGIWHIWTGYDHILFLLCLLLPSVLKKSPAGWVANDYFTDTFKQVAKIVTAFTLAHSITLVLAVLQLISLPSRLVESAIAFSIILVAINNLYPFFRERAWSIAFAFGLIHGFGFASVLGNLNLSSTNLGVSLTGFNLGVEIGQLAIVALFLPLAFLIRSHWFYRRIVLHSGSFAIMLLAMVWFLQRAFDLNMPII